MQEGYSAGALHIATPLYPLLKKTYGKGQKFINALIDQNTIRPGRRARTGTARAGAEDREPGGGEKKFRVSWEVGEALGKRHGGPG